ncbi:MAG: hypothetical protein HY540_01420 [Deltaproteobacteria bacterium]|nr:hypothetical protein [Deltaproteobacteria bacterium]
MHKFFVVVVLVCSLLFSFHVSAKSYRSELRQATKQGRIYDAKTWDANLLWHATLFTDDYRQTFDRKHIELQRLDSVEAARWIAGEQTQQSKGWEVFMGLYSKSDYKAFSSGAETFWHAELIGADGKKVQPVSVEAVPTTPYQFVMFPHLSRWAKTYRVVFPKIDLGTSPALSLWSVIGESKVTWKIK